MVKLLKNRSPMLVTLVLSTLLLSACVTENYENDKSTPMVHNDSSNIEIAMTRISLGLGYLNMGNTTQAKLNLEKAKRYAPDLAQVHTAFAHYYEKVGEPDLATGSFEMALNLSENDADTLNNYGVFLCRLGKYDAAEKQILKAISVPSYLLVSQSYENLAVCQLKDKRFDKAELYLEKAILHNPSSANVYLHMVQLKYAKSEYKNAQKFLKRYEKATRRFSPEALALAFKVYQQQRQLGTAKNYANMLVKMFPNSYEAKQYLLNGLNRINADQLADDYKLANLAGGKNASKKRIVVLSPNKKGQSQATLISKKDAQENKAKALAVKKPTVEVKDKAAIVKVSSAKLELNEDLVKPTQVMPTDVSAQTAKKVNKLAANKAYQELVQAQVTNVIDVPINNLSVKKQVAASAPHENSDAKETTAPETTAAQAIATPKATATTASKKVVKHVVKKGDSLFYISQKYNIKISALKEWNDLNGTKIIKIGDTIHLNNPEKVQTANE